MLSSVRRLLDSSDSTPARREARRLVLYIMIGCIGVATDFSLYSWLVMAGVHYGIALTCGCVIGTLISFILNRRYNFNVKDRTPQRIVLFFTAALIGYLTSLLVIWLLVSRLALHPILAKLVSLFFVFVVQYSFNRLITFRKIHKV